MAAIGEIDPMTGDMVMIDEDEMHHDDHATESHYHHDWNSKNNMGIREWDRDLHHEEYNHMLEGEYEHEYDEYYYNDDEDDDFEDDDFEDDNDEDSEFDEDNESQDTTPDDGEKTPATDDGEKTPATDDGEKTPATDDGDVNSVKEDIIEAGTDIAEGIKNEITTNTNIDVSGGLSPMP